MLEIATVCVKDSLRMRHVQCLSMTLFSACSCAMMPLNKILMMHLPHTPLTAIAGQMLLASVVMAIIPWTYDASTSEFYMSLTLPPLFATSLTTSMLSLKHTSVGSVIAVRNLAPLVSLPLEHALVERQHLSRYSTAALASVVCGCTMYVWSDTHTSALGIGLAACNMCVGVCDRLTQRYMLSATTTPRSTMLFVNNLFGGVFVVGLALATGEHSATALNTNTAWPSWGAAALVGLLMGYSSALAQSQVSATTHLFISNVNRILVLAISSVVLSEAMTMRKWLAAALSTAGTAAYAHSRISVTSSGYAAAPA